jgi:hypothetical protein
MGGVWGPPRSGALFVPDGESGRHVDAVHLQRRTLEYVLGRYAHAHGRLNISEAVLHSDLAVPTLRSMWELAALRLAGSAAAARPGSPLKAALVEAAAHARNQEGATPTWNWWGVLKPLLALAVPATETRPACTLGDMLNGATVTFKAPAAGQPAVSLSEWRAVTRAVVLGAGGRDATAWATRIKWRPATAVVAVRTPAAPPSAAVVAAAQAAPQAAAALAPPSHVHTTATANWLHAITGMGDVAFEKGSMALYLRWAPLDAAMAGRLDLRSGGRLFLRPGDASTGGGFLWGPKECTVCPPVTPGGAQPTLDTYHRVAVCVETREARDASFDAGIARAADRPVVRAALEEVRAAQDSEAGRAFVMLAALGGTLPESGPARLTSGLPPAWAGALGAPAPLGTAPRSDVLRSAAVSVTLPAFRALARAAAQPLWPLPVAEAADLEAAAPAPPGVEGGGGQAAL